ADAKDDVATQIDDVEDLITQNVDVLIVNPTDSEGSITAAEAANEAGIPIIALDRDIDGGELDSFIASDNIRGGEIAGEFFEEELDDGSNIVMLEGIPGASPTRDRGEGFHSVIDEIDELEIIESQPANFDRAKGLEVMENILESNDDIQAVFSQNDEMALGALEAIESAGRKDEMIVIGFDALDDALEAIEAGDLDGT